MYILFVSLSNEPFFNVALKFLFMVLQNVLIFVKTQTSYRILFLCQAHLFRSCKSKKLINGGRDSGGYDPHFTLTSQITKFLCFISDEHVCNRPQKMAEA